MRGARAFRFARPASGWLIALLLAAAVAPLLGLLWFMRQAVHNERLAVRQELLEAYRERLDVAQERLESDWAHVAELRLFTNAADGPAAVAGAVRAGLADGEVLVDARGAVVFPAPSPRPKWRSRPTEWPEAEAAEATEPLEAARQYAEMARTAADTNMAAEARQAEVRCLIRAGEISKALAVAQDLRGSDAVDAQGRLIAPNVEMMVLEARHVDPALFGFREQLEAAVAMPSAQRRFLMRRWEALFPKEPPFPTLAAEDLAARYLETGGELRGEAGLRLSKVPGIWQLPTADGRAVLLFDSTNLTARLRAQLKAQPGPAGAEIVALPPGTAAEHVVAAVEAGPALPGWKIAVALRDAQLFETAAQAQISSYLWAGVAAVGVVGVLAFLAVGLIRRQAALSQLRNDLVANVTHELKTPLSSMRLLVDTLLQSQPWREETAREYLELIARENLRLSRLIDNFLTFSRIERNKYAFDFAAVSPARIAETAADTMRERGLGADVRFDVSIAPGLPSIQADADALVTALLNLLDNAYKYSGDDKQISLAAEAENGSVFFIVKDNGIGLAPRETKRIFRRFYRVNQPPGRNAGGCGLGLSIVQFIVEAHQGTVRVESEPGRGSSFIITVPRGASEEASS